MRTRRLPPVVSVAAILLLAAAPGLCLSAYDVVQLSRRGYGEKQILDLIEATGSAFELSAADVARLKEAGVSERVIQEMLRRPAPDPETGDAGAPSAANEPGESVPRRGSVEERRTGGHADEAHAGGARASHAHHGDEPSGGQQRPRAEDRSSEALLTGFAVREEGSGGHEHVAVALGGMPVVILRDEGGYASIEGRADEVIRRLGEASLIGGGRFRAAHVRGADAVVFEGESDGRNVVLLTVSPRDARAYERRSGRSVTPDLLAGYWAQLLTDYWNIAVLGKPPAALGALHEGEALQELYDAVRSGARDGDPADRLAEASRRLSPSVQHHLERLAAAVPIGFAGDERRAGGEP